MGAGRGSLGKPRVASSRRCRDERTTSFLRQKLNQKNKTLLIGRLYNTLRQRDEAPSPVNRKFSL